MYPMEFPVYIAEPVLSTLRAVTECKLLSALSNWCLSLFQILNSPTHEQSSVFCESMFKLIIIYWCSNTTHGIGHIKISPIWCVLCNVGTLEHV